MIRRMLTQVDFRVALIGGLSALVVLLGALVGSWRTAAVGLALAVLVLQALVLLLVRAVRQRSRTVVSAEAPGDEVRGGGGILDELAVARAVQRALARTDLLARLDGLVRQRVAAERAEMAALLRLVTRHDTTPPIPVDAAPSAAQALALVDGVERLRPRRVLAVGTGVATLWVCGVLQDHGASLDLVCDDDDARALRDLVADRGATGTVDVVPVPRSVSDAPFVVHPWFVLPDSGPYDLVVVAAAPGEARAALPHLADLLDRLDPAGAVLVLEDPEIPVLRTAWAGASAVEIDEPAGAAVGAHGLVLRPLQR